MRSRDRWLEEELGLTSGPLGDAQAGDGVVSISFYPLEGSTT